MNSIRSLSSLTICLCIQLSLCLLGSTSASTSLWGKTLHFKGRPCVWQLQPDAVVPALKELSVCVLLRRSYATTWTGFIYKAPGGRNIELGLGGTAQRLRIYVNGNSQHEATVNPIPPKQLAQNGTLTLGVSHYVDKNGEVQRENGKDLLGEIGLFRMWAREWSAEELKRQSCADGDVLSWDLRQWKYNCPPEPDNNLHCAWSLYKIKMWTSIVHSTKPGNCSMSLENITRNWLESIFPHNISVHNIFVSSQSFSCEVHVNVDPAASVEVVQANLTVLLSSTFSSDILNLTADPDSISIVPMGGSILFNDKTTTNCQHWCNFISKLDIETDTTTWADPDMTNCNPVVTILELNNITVTTGNAAEVVDVIQDLVDAQLGNTAELSSSELDTVVEKLNQVVDISIVKPAVGAKIFNIVADILLSKTDVTPVANIVLHLTDRMGANMNFQGDSVNLTAPSLALSMINVDTDEFSGLTFGVSFSSSNLVPKDPLTTTAIHSSWILNSYIVSASINDSYVNNLKDPVVVTHRHKNPKQPGDRVQCGQGGWNSTGCETQSISPDQTICFCDHLTHFAVLLDVSRAPVSEADNQILTLISYLGCGISSIFLGITLLTYLAFEQLRRDHPSKILINLSAALLGMSMLFLLDSWLSSFFNYGLCIATAATLHYFLLASFTWMGLEAVHMYLALVKVFNIYIPSYILKFCVAGWGIPLVIVSLVLAIDKDAYGNAVRKDSAVVLQSTDPFCWLQNDVFFYVTVVAFVLLILLCNVSVFIVVLIQIRQMRANKPSANSRSTLNDLRAVASLTVLLGLTWSMGFFSFGPARVVLMYLFSIFNTLQGKKMSCSW
eukprot:superscaffoldBa00000519_g5373